MTLHEPSAHEVETFTGRYVDTRRPKPETICIEDIAHALSQVCRYGGHCRYHYSVAQHCVFVRERLRRQGHSRNCQLAGLLHDGSEAYLGDIPRPMKKLLGRAYEILTDRMDRAVIAGLELPFDLAAFHAPAVKNADNWSLLVEAKHLLPSQGINWTGSQMEDWGVRYDRMPSRIVVPDYWLGSLQPHEAEQLFLSTYKELTT
jgi:hypothetical protein